MDAKSAADAGQATQRSEAQWSRGSGELLEHLSFRDARCRSRIHQNADHTIFSRLLCPIIHFLAGQFLFLLAIGPAIALLPTVFLEIILVAFARVSLQMTGKHPIILTDRQ